MADLLIEIGCEELPADAIVPLARGLATGLLATLVDAELVAAPASLGGTGPEPEWFATPRRIAARWPDAAAAQPDREVERRGPAVAAAYDGDGAPTKALAGFLRSASAELDDLETLETPKGAWVMLRRRQAGRALADVVGEALPGIVASLPMPRRMRWGAGDAEFLRPVEWLLALHGEKTLPLELFGLAAGRETRGHRFHAPEPVALADAADYEATLERAHVVADFAARRERVVDGAREAVAAIDPTTLAIEGPAVPGHASEPLAPRLDDALVDEVTALVEWPVALVGRFDAAFLDLPKEALVQTMEENQRYFAVLDGGGELGDAFVVVANLESSDPATVVAGNERVIRPRFEDTQFFWEQDRLRTQDHQRSLADFRPALDRVLFQEKLGSVGDKVERLRSLGVALCGLLGRESLAVEVDLAASLCKCDLASAIVGELPKMQGIAGDHYARLDGHPPEVADAMSAHYLPTQAGGPLPYLTVGQTLALADKLDTLVGIYGQGLVPTGAKDPFGLRRAAIGIVRILLADHPHLRETRTEGDGWRFPRGEAIDVDLAELVAAAARAYAGRLDDIDEEAIVGYVVERLRGLLLERGASADALDAVLAKGITHPLDIVLRLEAIEAFRTDEAAPVLAAASKRARNILRKSGAEAADAVDADVLVEEAERALHERLEALRPEIESRLERRDYAEAMRLTATLREPLDAFFDAVMVMDEDPRLRANRLALLGELERLCGATAELSRLTPKDAAPEGAAGAGTGAGTGERTDTPSSAGAGT